MSQPTPAQQHENLIAQEKSILEQKARLAEQMKTFDDALIAVRGAIQGVQLGYDIARQQAAKQAADNAPAPNEE